MHRIIHGVEYMKPGHKLFAIAVILPLCWLFYNNSANWHYHQDDLGNPVRHSHPYTTVPVNCCDETIPFDSNHEHTSSELFLLAMITNAGILVLLAMVLHYLQFPALRFRRPEITAEYFSRPDYAFPLLRAPPVFC